MKTFEDWLYENDDRTDMVSLDPKGLARQAWEAGMEQGRQEEKQAQAQREAFADATT